MALSDLRLPGQYTLEDVLASMRAPLQARMQQGDELSRPERRLLEDGYIGENFDFNAWQAEQFNNELRKAGYVEVGANTGGRSGLQSVIDRSAEAQRRGIRTVEDYYSSQNGTGQFEIDPRTGKEYYKGETTDQRNPFDFGTAEPDHWTSKLALGAILAGFGAAGGAALGGGAAAGEGAGAGWVSAEGGAGYAGGMAADAGALSGAAGSGGNVGFFDDILGNISSGVQNLFGTGADTSLADFAAADAAQLAAQGIPQAQIETILSQSYGFDALAAADLAQLAGQGLSPQQIAQVASAPGSSLGSSLSSGGFNFLPNSSTLQKLLLGSQANGQPNGLDQLLGKNGLFGGNGALGGALALGPSLAAINYAKNQGPFDTSKLDSIYNGLQGNQSPYLKSLTDPYDETTAQGYGRLTQSLQDRGVSGSSFGNMDLTNYNTVRDRGRADILGTGMNNQLTLQSGVASKLLDAQAKERELKNNLYGSALYALAGGLRPQQTNVLGR